MRHVCAVFAVLLVCVLVAGARAQDEAAPERPPQYLHKSYVLLGSRWDQAVELYKLDEEQQEALKAIMEQLHEKQQAFTEEHKAELEPLEQEMKEAGDDREKRRAVYLKRAEIMRPHYEEVKPLNDKALALLTEQQRAIKEDAAVVGRLLGNLPFARATNDQKLALLGVVREFMAENPEFEMRDAEARKKLQEALKAAHAAMQEEEPAEQE
jgi:Spy/CpxP family protein refolding chaperone